MPRSVLTLLVLITQLVAQSQSAALPAEATRFLTSGYEMLDYKQGDLNADKRPDAILILKQIGEDTLYGEQTPRPFIILIRQANGKLKQALRNDSLVMCRHCGGVFGDPYQQVDISNNRFSVFFYGGSAWRWAYQYEFSWKSLKKNWFLVLESRSGFHTGDTNMIMTNAEIKEIELGQVPVNKFNSEPVYEDSRWKVNATKTYFYDSPELNSMPRKGYLIKGDFVTGIRHLKNFIEVSYDNDKAVVTTGYILKKDLLRVK